MLQASRHLCHPLSQHGAGDVRHVELCGRGRKAGRRDSLCPRQAKSSPTGTACWFRRPMPGRWPRRRSTCSTMMKGAASSPLDAYGRGRSMLWPRVVEQSLARLPTRARLVAHRGLEPRPAALPLDAVERMTDAVGIMQHGICSVPDRDHGYCIDDNARALIMMVRRGDDRRTAALSSTYAAFVQHGWHPSRRRFRNFMGYDRRWLEECGSEDSNGRTHLGAWAHCGQCAVAIDSRLGVEAVRRGRTDW